MTRQEAADQYQALVMKVTTTGGNGSTSQSATKASSRGGPQVSVLVQETSLDPLPDTPYERFKSLMKTASEKMLLENLVPALINERDEEHRTLLHWAADGNHVKAIRVLVNSGADINALDDEDLSPLTYAVCNDFMEAARLLVQLGADCENARDFARGEMKNILKL